MKIKKTLLVVGASYGQVPAIKKAKEMGFRVCTIDRNTDAPGMAMADISYEIDVKDNEAILEVAQKHSVDGAMTLQSEFGVPAVGYVNDYMNLNGISYETAIRCSDKTKCRLRLEEKNYSQPKFRMVQNLDEARKAIKILELPVIVKTPDSSASRGVTKVAEASDVEDAVRNAFNNSNKNYVLVEEFIEGLEFGAQTFSVNGECSLVLMHNDTLTNSPKMIPIGHSFPFTMQDDKKEKQAIEAIKKAVEALGIISGPANVDLILDQQTELVKIIEIGARMGATCLPELVQYNTGIDWVAESVKSALGLEPDLTITKNQPVAAMIVQSPKDGTYRDYRLNCKPEDYNVIEYEVTPNKGEKVNKLRNGTDRIGKVIAYGTDALDAEKNAKEFLDQILIEIE